MYVCIRIYMYIYIYIYIYIFIMYSVLVPKGCGAIMQFSQTHRADMSRMHGSKN